MKGEKILIFSKKKNLYTGECKDVLINSGLSNSIRFVADMLNKNGIPTYTYQAIDGNCLDRQITIVKPTTVIIEAIWVTPDKLALLQQLHKKVHFIVRIHSEIPFLANEGIALDWLFEYYRNGVTISSNSERCVTDLRKLGIKSVLLPNYYPLSDPPPKIPHADDEVHIGCLGAIRPMKNQLIQAVASIDYANKNGKRLFFYINTNREEQGGASVLKNLRNLFKNTRHVLMECGWMPHETFVKVMVRKLDIGLQVSFSETYNIVTADLVNANIPVVVSDEINWLPKYTHADTNCTKDITRAIARNLRLYNLFGSLYTRRNKNALKCANKRSVNAWLEYFK